MTTKPTDVDRIVLDVSASLRWAGSPIGIVRVERELAHWMSSNAVCKTFVFFDPDKQAYRKLNPKYERLLISGEAAIDETGLSDPTRVNRHFCDRMPAFLRPASLWVLRFPHMMLRRLEEMRLSTESERLRRLLDLVQRAMMSAKQRTAMVARDGTRRPYLSIGLACGECINFTKRDILLSAGAGWLHTNIEIIRDLKLRTGLRFVLLSHDIIPLLFPQFYRAHDVEAFRRFYEVAVPLSDLLIFSTRTGQRDAFEHFASQGLPIPRAAVAAMGSKVFARARVDRPVPEGLTKDRYILFVSTIEPRKGHEFIYDVWLRLLAAGVPQATGFKLVFVGRQGWQMEHFFQRLRTEPTSHGSLQILSNVNDESLSVLYDNASFCIYPSIYEGYGLPLVEAFAFGKTVVSSTGGALAEVAGEFALCLDPQDAEAWFQALKAWMEDSSLRRTYELAIRERFSHPSWPEVSRRIVALASSLGREDEARL